MKQIPATVISNRQILSLPEAKYYIMRIQAPEIASSCKPGQFVMLQCGNDTLLRRPISIHSVSVGTDIEILYAFTGTGSTAGAGTKWLSQLTSGSSLDIIGPSGNSFTIGPATRRVLLIAGGIGVAPLKFLADSAISQRKEVVIMMGARTAAGVLPHDLIPTAAELFIATEDGSLGKKGRILDFIPDYSGQTDQIFACGPVAMYEALARQIKDQSIKVPVQVSLEVRMGCGTGICYSCSIKTKQGMKRVCKEGPVFDIRDIIWQEVRT